MAFTGTLTRPEKRIRQEGIEQTRYALSMIQEKCRTSGDRTRPRTSHRLVQTLSVVVRFDPCIGGARPPFAAPDLHFHDTKEVTETKHMFTP
jgi:hypothetical protein